MEKSQAAGFLLTLFFGPLGLLYSSIPAALFLTAVGLVCSWATAQVMGVIVVWPVAILTSYFTVRKHNREVEKDRLRKLSRNR